MWEETARYEFVAFTGGFEYMGRLLPFPVSASVDEQCLALQLPRLVIYTT